MGCDIHFYTERYTDDVGDDAFQGPKGTSEERNSKLNEVLEENTSGERWVSADTWELERDWDDEENEDAKCWGVPWENSFYRERNYYAFSVLADVRNYDDDITPICQPRGIPEDASDGYKYLYERYGVDGHSHTYFTLEELLNVDWEKYNSGEYQGWLDNFLKTIERMKSIDPDPARVRAVFFFDN